MYLIHALYILNLHKFVLVQSLNHVRLFATPWTATCQASLSFTVSQSLLKFMSTESMMLSNYLILCHPLLVLPPMFPSISVFINELYLAIRWPKHWSFGFRISPSNEHSGLISFRIDWYGLLLIQGILKSLIQHPITSSVLSLLYGIIITSIHDYWKNHSLDYIYFCWQRYIFLILNLGSS